LSDFVAYRFEANKTLVKKILAEQADFSRILRAIAKHAGVDLGVIPALFHCSYTSDKLELWVFMSEHYDALQMDGWKSRSLLLP